MRAARCSGSSSSTSWKQLPDSMNWPAFPRYPDPLRKWARLAPGRIALVDRASRKRISYRDLDATADRWGAVLLAEGARKGDRIAVIAGNRREVVELFFACIRIGAALVPLNWRLTAVELSAILEHAKAALVIGENRFRECLAGHDKWLDLDEMSARLETVQIPGVEGVAVSADDAVLVLYTSGSTGTPKGVIIPHRQILFNAIATTTAWELSHADIAPVATPFFHTGGWNVFATPLWHIGGTVVLFDRFEPDDFLKGMAEEGCTVVLTVPTQLVMMRDCASWGTKLPSLRFFISGGAPCPASLIDEVRNKGYTLKTGYGLTECGPNCFAISNDGALRRPGSVGWPVPFLEMSLRREDDSEAEVDQPGELLLRGPQMFGGYLHDPEKTADAVTDGWLRTGDLAKRDADGAYYICGRKKEMFISGGENVFPAEVEAALGSHPSVAEVVVVGIEDSLWGEVGRAYVILRPGTEKVPEEELLKFARGLLARYKIPKSIVYMSDFPRLGSGKPDRRALAAGMAYAETSVTR